MANSIANLAVVISGHTKPLEAAMKKAESKVSSFGHSMKEGFMLGAGVMGLDKLEGAMKKAIAGNEELTAAAEKAEVSFGNILLKVTGIGAALPKAASALEQFSAYLDKTDKKSGFMFDVQVFKEQAASLFMSSETRAKELQVMRQQFEEITRLAQVEQWQADLAKQKLEAQQKKDELVKSELEAYSKTLSGKLDSLDPMREELRIAEQLKAVKDPFLKFEIEMRQLRLKELEKEKQEYEEWQKMYEETIRMESEGEQHGPITQMQAELEKKNALIAEGRKLLLDQVPAVEQLRKKYEEAQKAGLTGDELKAFEKAYKDAKLQQDQANAIPIQLGGAATAGSEAAYSIIANAQANTIKPEMQAQTKELKSQTQLLTQIKDNTPKPGDFAFGIYRMEL